MNCNEVSALFEALHDGALSTKIKADMLGHVKTCSSCNVKLLRIQALSDLLQKSLIPAPTSELDARLMGAFSRLYREQKLPWWRRAFTGSVSIPKPAFAAALVALAVALAAVAMIGRGTSMPHGGVTALPENRNAAHTQPEVVERTKIIEVPVVREKVVTRIVFVSRERQRSRKVQGPTVAADQDERELAMSGSVSKNGYFTLADLTDFQPAKETKARVIREIKPNEK